MASTRKHLLVSAQALTGDLTTDSEALDQSEVDLVAFISATSVNAATTVTAKIQHSPDGVVWFDLIAFTAIVGAAGSELKIPSSMYPLTLIRATVVLAGATKAATVTISCNTRKAA